MHGLVRMAVHEAAVFGCMFCFVCLINNEVSCVFMSMDGGIM